MLGRYVRVKVTSPIHSKDPKEGLTYGLNCGEINFVTARKRETLNGCLHSVLVFVTDLIHAAPSFRLQFFDRHRKSEISLSTTEADHRRLEIPQDAPPGVLLAS